MKAWEKTGLKGIQSHDLHYCSTEILADGQFTHTTGSRQEEEVIRSYDLELDSLTEPNRKLGN